MLHSKGKPSRLHTAFAVGHLQTRVHILSVESPSLSWPCPLTGERERISVATVCGPGIMAAAPFPDLRLFSWGNNSAQMARSQVGWPQDGQGTWPSSSHGHRVDIRGKELKASFGSISSHLSPTHSCTHTLTHSFSKQLWSAWHEGHCGEQDVVLLSGSTNKRAETRRFSSWSCHVLAM